MRVGRVLSYILAFFAMSVVSSVAESSEKPVDKSKWNELLKKLDRAEAQGSDQRGEMEIVLVENGEEGKRMKAIFFQKGSKYRLVQFKAPANLAGLGVLIRGEAIYLYLPKFRRVRRIASHVKNQSFMGTDLSFDDLGSLKYSEKFQIKGAWKLPSGGYKLLLVPKDSSSSYKKLEVFLRKDYLLKKIDYYNSKGKKIKTMVRSDFKKVKGYLFPYRTEVCDLIKKHCTRILMRKVKMDTGISSRFFTRRYLKRDLDL